MATTNTTQEITIKELIEKARTTALSYGQEVNPHKKGAITKALNKMKVQMMERKSEFNVYYNSLSVEEEQKLKAAFSFMF